MGGRRLYVVEAEGLVKRFAKVVAVDGLSLSIREGEVFGLLGPNGAGKTTTIRLLLGLTHPTEGRLRVCGHDPTREPQAVRRCVGYVGQEIAVDPYLTARENLMVFAGLYHLRGDERRRRIEEVLELVGLAERADDVVRTFSGGMKKRLDIACGLLHRPRLLFLDEPTLGLDVETRRRVWDFVKDLAGQGMTVLLTTHYLEEADRLCDRVAIIDRGKLQAVGRPQELKDGLGGDVLRLRLAEEAPLSAAVEALQRLPCVTTVQPVDGVLTARVQSGESALPQVMDALARAGIGVAAVSWSRPTLDDVFLAHTGRRLEAHGV